MELQPIMNPKAFIEPPVLCTSPVQSAQLVRQFRKPVAKFRDQIFVMHCTDGCVMHCEVINFISGFPTMEESMIKHPLEVVTYVTGPLAWHFMKGKALNKN